MGFNFKDESTQEFPSPSSYAGSVAFLFRDTTLQHLYTTMRSLGASPAKLGAGWVLPVSGQPLLEIRLIEDVRDYAIDLIWEAWKFYVPLLDALGVNEENALIIDVRVRNDASAREALVHPDNAPESPRGRKRQQHRTCLDTGGDREQLNPKRANVFRGRRCRGWRGGYSLNR